MFCKKGALKYLAKLTGKHVDRGLYQKNIQAVGLELYLKRGSYKVFFLWHFQNSFFIASYKRESLPLI